MFFGHLDLMAHAVAEHSLREKSFSGFEEVKGRAGALFCWFASSILQSQAHQIFHAGGLRGGPVMMVEFAPQSPIRMNPEVVAAPCPFKHLLLFFFPADVLHLTTTTVGARREEHTHHTGR